MLPSSPDISVIICTYTEARWDDLCTAIESVQQQTTPPREIIVVVDHNPCLLTRVRTHLSGLKVVENLQPPGLSGARNSGLALAQGQIIAFLDEDAIAEPDWLRQLGISYEHPYVLGVGGVIEPLWLTGQPRWFPAEFNWVVGCTYKGMPQTSSPVRNLIGCNMSFRREVFEKHGDFRHGIGRVGARPVGCEETEFCIRINQREAEAIFLYQPQARVHHRVTAQRTHWGYFCSRCYAEGWSKALVSHLVGAGPGLATERSYIRRTLSQGIVQGIADAFQRHNLLGLVRAGTIMAGLAVTSVGFGLGLVSQWLTEARQKIMAIALFKRITSFFKSDIPNAAPAEPKFTSGRIRTEAAAWPGLSKAEPEHNLVLTDAPFVSVVVATRDRTANLVLCLDSLLALDYPNYEIIVVDNAPSTSATADFIRQTYGDLPQVRYLREDRPGLAVAHNRALVEIKTEIVAFTDDDVVVDRQWLTALVKAFDLAENVACVTGLILPAELETPAQRWFEQYGGFSKGFTRRIFDLSEHRPPSPLYPYNAGRFGTGANMAFKTSALRTLGGFDPALGTGTVTMGGDDLAAFFQVIINGYRLIYEPAARVYHWHHRHYTGLRRQMYGYGVGLTAYLTKVLLDRPRLLFDFVLKIPAGLVYLFSPHSLKNRRKLADYPAELTRLERQGMLYGPLAYRRSRRQIRQLKQRSGLPESSLNEAAKKSLCSTRNLTEEVSRL